MLNETNRMIEKYNPADQGSQAEKEKTKRGKTENWMNSGRPLQKRSKLLKLHLKRKYKVNQKSEENRATDS